MLNKMLPLYFTVFGFIFGITHGQLTPPATGDAPCEPVPAEVSGDYAFGLPDSAGFRKIFNGIDFTGWWNNCLTGYSSSNREQGIIARVSPEEEALYMDMREDAGGALMTRKKFTHYEIIFDYWPEYGNVHGIYNRTDEFGRSYKTKLDYRNSGSVGGAWGNLGFGGRDLLPWGYSSETNINVNTGRGASWTEITAALNPTQYGCNVSGCKPSDYTRLWDPDGWNQIRIQFYGGHVLDNTFKMKSWFRKFGDTVWVPILHDTTWNHAPVEEGYIGIGQHHGGDENGAWFRNILLRELEEDGTPIIPGCRDQGDNDYNPNATVDFPGACEVTTNIPEFQPMLTDGFEFKNNLTVNVVHAGNYELQLLDVEGKRIQVKTVVNPETHSFMTDKLEAGLYFFRVLKGNQKFVKKYVVK